MKTNNKLVSKFIPLSMARILVAMFAKVKRNFNVANQSSDLRDFVKKMRTPQCHLEMMENLTFNAHGEEVESQQINKSKGQISQKYCELMIRAIQQVSHIVNNPIPGNDVLMISALQSIPVLLELSDDDHIKHFAGIQRYLDLVLHPDTSLQVRKCAAAFLGLLSSGQI